jgi:hypothetical protein
MGEGTFNGWPRIRALAWATLSAVACFAVSIAFLHWFQPDLDPLNEAISYYVHGSQGWLLTFGLLTLGLGSMALTIALASQPGGTNSRGGNWCLGIWSVGAIVGAVFSADPPGHWDKPPSISGSIHGLAAMVALTVFPFATLLWSRRFRSDARWAGLSFPLLLLATASAATLVTFLLSLVPVFVRPGPPVLLGLTERILFAVYISWLAVAAIGLLRLSGRRSAEPSAAPSAAAPSELAVPEPRRGRHR